ncbi:hypothetical protein OG563_30565 [Nocardia vinacea]|uniref:Uncharacterized protein n=1 Tax=Nocardia vinacea TaxID=96468 RepID=A0ABZ1YP82_9NOCA|nr:hypothetical protein [Nocardia vinacea]
MPSICEYYRIMRPVPFVDVELTVDNLLFVDPHVIRLATGPQPFEDMAEYCMDTFFKEVTACVLSSSASENRRGLDLLQHFGEPRETRLGMSAAGINGHGGSTVIGSHIYDVLSGPDIEPLLRVGILREVEALALFVPGIDRDRCSDLTTRIIFAALARFTAEVVATHPEFKTRGGGMTTVIRQVWDPDLRLWMEKPVELPVAAGQPLLLVPTHWVRRTLLMSSGRFYGTEVLSWAQLEQAVVREGRTLKTPKWKLRQQAGLARGRSTNAAVTLRAFEQEETDLVANFKVMVDAKYARLEDEHAA